MTARPEQWHFLTNEDKDLKPHAVPESLLNLLVDDLRERGTSSVSASPIDKFSMDRGGMVRVDRPTRSWHVAGVKLSLACEYVGEFLREVRESRVRAFAGEVAYYKVHCHWNCIVMSPEIRQEVLSTVGRDEAECEAEAERFYRSIG